MSARRRKFEVWTAISLALFLMFAVFFIYPICTLLRRGLHDEGGGVHPRQLRQVFQQALLL